MLVTRGGERVDIPHEPGEWMMLRALDWRELKEARDAKRVEVRDNIKTFDPDAVKALQAWRTDDDEPAPEAPVDPLTTYDLALMLRGIAGWSYDAELDDETRGQLDEVTAMWAAREILDRSTLGASKGKSDELSNGSTPAVATGLASS